MGMMLLAALAIGACGDEGGELREVTRRRQAELDTTSADARDTGAAGDTETRLPAFTDDTAKKLPADTAKKDTAKTTATTPLPGWTAGTLRGGDAGVRATLRGLRAAANTGFDRLVLDFGDDAIPAWKAEYVDQPVHQCGSGDPVRLGTDAVLSIKLRSTQAHDDEGKPTVRQRDLSLNMPLMKRMVVICDFEGEVEIAIGVAGPQPYRVNVLQNPSRLAIDVQQQP